MKPKDRELFLFQSSFSSFSFDNRNLQEEADGLVDEINFENFLTIMSNFRPIEMNMDEEQLNRFRKQKLKCKRMPLLILGGPSSVCQDRKQV